MKSFLSMKILYKPNQYSQQRQHEKKRWIYPIRLAMEATYYKNQGHYVKFDSNTPYENKYDRVIVEPEGLPFLDLPCADRIFTKAFDEKYQNNGNFLYTPATYILSASGCWHGKCTFCIEKGKKYEVRDVDDVINEIDSLNRLGFKEVFDDSATFPDGKWLTEFCIKKINHNSISNFPISCNMRIGANVDFKLMKRAGFRMLLFGVESANQETLDKIKKGIKYEQVTETLKQAKEAGLATHIAVMYGYPWEENQDSKETLKFVHYLLRKGYATTAQASFFTAEGYKQNKEGKQYIKRIYDVAFKPFTYETLNFWYNRLRGIKSISDIKYLYKQIRAGMKERFYV